MHFEYIPEKGWINQENIDPKKYTLKTLSGKVIDIPNYKESLSKFTENLVKEYGGLMLKLNIDLNGDNKLEEIVSALKGYCKGDIKFKFHENLVPVIESSENVMPMLHVNDDKSVDNFLSMITTDQGFGGILSCNILTGEWKNQSQFYTYMQVMETMYYRDITTLKKELDAAVTDIKLIKSYFDHVTETDSNIEGFLKLFRKAIPSENSITITGTKDDNKQ